MPFVDLSRMKWIVPKIKRKYFLFLAELAKFPINARNTVECYHIYHKGDIQQNDTGREQNIATHIEIPLIMIKGILSVMELMILVIGKIRP